MKTKAVNLISKYKYELAAFLLLCIQACINIDFSRGMSERFYSYYLVDFSMGKTSRLLIGSLVNLLTDRPTVVWINCFAAVVLVLTFALTSILIGRIIKSVDSEMRSCIVVFSLFFVSGAFTFYGFSKFFGLLDIYMYLLAVFSVLVVKHKLLRWLIPLFCVCGVLINYAFPISYFLIIALVLLYLIFTEEKKAGNIIILLLSCLLSAAIMLFCIFYGKHTTTVTFDEMWQIMEQKIGMELEYSHVSYYDYYLFGNEEREALVGVELDGMTPAEFVKAYMKYMTMFGYNTSDMLSVAFGALPVLAVFWTIWLRCIKTSETKGKKFVYACFMLSALGIVACCLTSTDFTRWAGSGVMVQFCLGYYMFKAKDKPFEKAMGEIREFLKGKAFLAGIVYVVYASLISLFNITG